MKNQSLKFVTPSLKSAAAAAATAAIPENLLYDPIYAPGDAAYPITSPTWILAYKTQSTRRRAPRSRRSSTYILSPKGQKLALTVNFAPLPAGLAKTGARRREADRLIAG